MSETTAPVAQTQPQQQTMSTHDAFVTVCRLISGRRLDHANQLLDAVLTADPGQAECRYLAGVVAERTGRLEDAERLKQQAISKAADVGLFWRNLAEAFRRASALDDALDAGLKSTALRPNDAHAWLNMSMVRHDRRDLAECTDACLRAIAINDGLASAHFRLAENLLLQGDYAQGLEKYEWRFRVPGAAQPIAEFWNRAWDGKPISGTLILVADQGYGDAFQFSRYIPWAASRAGRVELAASAELVPVLSAMPGVARTFSVWNQMPIYQAWAPLSGLLRLAGTRVETIPQPVYVRAYPPKAQFWKERFASAIAPELRRIGIVWSGRPTHNNDFNRSVDFETLRPLTQLPGVAFVSLQKDPGRQQLRGYNGAPIFDVADALSDFGESLAIIENLDMVICVDTSVAHLAGIGNKPTWVMLPYIPDWRWLLDRSDTPWYPNLRLFRQSAKRDWPEVIAKVAEALAALPPPPPRL